MVMINDVLNAVRDRIETVLQNAQPRSEQWTILSNLSEQDGSFPQQAKDKIVLSVVSLQFDSSTSAYLPPRMGQDDRYPVTAPPLYLDVYVLLMASFSGGNYAAGLGLLSRAITLFQETPVLTPNLAPGLPPGMDRLVTEFVDLDFAAANNLLAAAGAKAFPHVLLKLRRLPFEGPAISAIAPAVKALDPPRGGQTAG